MARHISDLNILSSREIAKEVFVLELEGIPADAEIRPGQFVQIKIEGSGATFLRRPFSVHDYDTGSRVLKLLIQVAGKGSAQLSRSKPGDRLNLVYPLGNTFTLPSSDERILLVGGGCGVAPLMFLGRRIRELGMTPEFLLGFRNMDSIIERNDYELLGKVWITTEDGSAGEKGFVTDHTILAEGSFDRIYCCGPEPMMKAVASYARAREAECEVSLEHLMACGFGVCLCCVVDTTSGNLCTCTDGPVFNIKNLKW